MVRPGHCCNSVVTSWLPGMQRNVSKPDLYHPQGTALCAAISTQLMGSFQYFGDSLWSISSVDRTAQWPVSKLVPDTAIGYWQASREIYQHIPPSLLLLISRWLWRPYWLSVWC